MAKRYPLEEVATNCQVPWPSGSRYQWPRRTGLTVTFAEDVALHVEYSTDISGGWGDRTLTTYHYAFKVFKTHKHASLATLQRVVSTEDFACPHNSKRPLAPRAEPDSNRRITALQAAAYPLCHLLNKKNTASS
jgi:hypothetical protein